MRTIIILLVSMMSIASYSSDKRHLIDDLKSSNQTDQKLQHIDFRQMKQHKPLQVGDERHIEFEKESTLRARSKKSTNEEFWVNSFKYEITNGNEVKLTYAYPTNDTLIVPEKVSYNDVEYTVTSVGSRGAYSVSINDSIFKVVLPASIKRIEAYAFYNQTKLQIINLPTNLEYIGEAAFEECTSLQNIIFSAKLNEIANYAFFNCSSLSNVYFPASLTKLGAGVFRYCNSITEFIIPAGLTSIGTAAFTDCKNLTGIMVSNSNPNYSSLNGVLYDKQKTKLMAYSNKASNSISFVIPESVDTIDSRAFANTDIESVVLPSNLKAIKTNAFGTCTKLGSISIPASTVEIAGNPFVGCTLLRQITVHANNSNFESLNGLLYTKNRQILKAVPLMFEGILSVDPLTIEIGSYAMYYCEKITRLNLPASLQKIGYTSIYNCTGLSSIVIPNSVTTIDAWAFGWNENLQTVQMSNSLSSLGNYAFYNCPILTSILLPNSLPVLNSYTFGFNESLTNVQLPSGLESIGNSCFYKCSNLTAIQLPAGLNSIGDWAFGQTGLTEISVPNTVTTLGFGVFVSCESLKKAVLPQSLTEIGYAAFKNCILLEEINIPSQLTSIDYYAFNGCARLPGVTLPSTINFIGSYAFNNCSSLAYVNNLENTSIEAIENYAFANCKKLQTIKMPNSVKVIWDYAFDGDSLLSVVQMSNQITSIGNRAFRFCAALKSITLPETLTHIYDRAFLGSGLESIHLPKSVEYLGEEVFLRCYNLLEFRVDKDNVRFSDIEGVLFNKDATELIHYPIAKTNNSYTLPETVSGIAFGAFYQAGNLVSVVLPNNLKVISDYAFGWSDKLANINLSNVVRFGFASFADCTAIQNITLSEDFESADNYAFTGCSNLKKVTVKNSITPKIYSRTFEDVPMDVCILEVPIGAKQSYQNHEVWGQFNTINEVDFGTSLITGTFTDSRDGNEYKWVKIGNQIWMAENLRYLPSVAGPATHSKTAPYRYVYGYDGTSVSTAKATANYSTYGALYNWPAAMAAAPEGWQLPSDAEWSELENYLADNGYNYDGSIGGGRAKIGKSMASLSGWNSDTELGSVGNNDYPEFRNKSGFNALPAGHLPLNREFEGIGRYTFYWSSTGLIESEPFYRALGKDYAGIVRDDESDKAWVQSVRCIKNVATGLDNQLMSDLKNNLQTFPNPVTEVLHIDLTNKNAAGTISILTLDGKVLHTQSTSGNDMVTMQLQHLPKGIYLCRYASQSEIITAKIVKQ